MLASLRGGDGEMRAAVRASCLIAAIGISPAFAQTATLLEKFKDWSAYTNGTRNPALAAARPKPPNPPKAKRGPILFSISRGPADHVDGEISVKMGSPLKEG